jgi:hypothetical protein
MSPVVVTRLSGGLGNQLFQYAAARAIAKRRNARLLLDISGFQDHGEGRAYALNVYQLAIETIRGSVIDAACKWAFIPAQGDIAENRIAIYREDNYEFEPELMRGSGSIYLYGFWQSWKYFSDIEDELRQTLRIPQRFRTYDLSRNSVSVHIRRGDYLNLKVQRSFGQCELGYYEAAVSLMRERVRDARFLVFSDDPMWCEQHFAGGDFEIVSSASSSAAEDLQLMAECRHHIVANSSFSWWGAWLGLADESIVIAPIPWYNASPRADDLIPKRWLRFERSAGTPWPMSARSEHELISIVVLARGNDEQLAKALASAHAQIGVTIEIVLASGESYGVSLNAALARARGKWIAFLDECDSWKSEKLCIQLEAAKLVGAQVVGCRTIPVLGPAGIPATYPPPGRPDCDLEQLLQDDYYIAGISHVLLRRELIEKLAPFEDGWTPEKPSSTMAQLLNHESALLLWQRLVQSPIPYLAHRS